MWTIIGVLTRTAIGDACQPTPSDQAMFAFQVRDGDAKLARELLELLAEQLVLENVVNMSGGILKNVNVGGA